MKMSFMNNIQVQKKINVNRGSLIISILFLRFLGIVEKKTFIFEIYFFFLLMAEEN